MRCPNQEAVAKNIASSRPWLAVRDQALGDREYDANSRRIFVVRTAAPTVRKLTMKCHELLIFCEVDTMASADSKAATKIAANRQSVPSHGNSSEFPHHIRQPKTAAATRLSPKPNSSVQISRFAWSIVSADSIRLASGMTDCQPRPRRVLVRRDHARRTALHWRLDFGSW